MNTQEICGILENVDPRNLGYGKRSENTIELEEIGYVQTSFVEIEKGTWFGKLTDRGIRFLKQNKPESDFFKLRD